MLPKAKRLTSSEVKEVMETGQTIISGLFLVKFLKNSENITKISAIAPKKTFKLATERNKAKRRMNSALSPILNKYKVEKPLLIAMLCSRKILSEKIPQISKEIEQIFIKGGIL